MQITFSKAVAAALFLSVCLMQAGSLIAAAEPERLDSQASMTRNQAQYTRGEDRGEEPEEKPDRFVLLEWLIREKLMQQYQNVNFATKLEEPDY